MAVELQPRGTQSAISIRISAPLEVTVHFCAVQRACGLEELDDWNVEFRRVHADLIEKADRFFGDDEMPSEWGELLVLADASGTLFDEDMDRLLARLEATAAATRPAPRLESEDGPTRASIISRLERLRTSADLRADYGALVREIWDALRPAWEKHGLPRARAEANRLNRLLREGARLQDLLPRTHIAQRQAFDGLVADAVARHQMTVVPLGLPRFGSIIFALPSGVVAGFGYAAGDSAQYWRAAAERAATRFKVMSDPTRVALLSLLLERPMSITDLGQYFELSQPTVSVHVKILREAGLLVSEKAGTHTLYRAHTSTVRGYIGEALASFTSGSHQS